jgi:hypothetical protein
MKRQRKNGYAAAVPTVSADNNVEVVPFMKMNSTYLLKGRGDMPSAGNQYPWLPRASYFSDMWEAKYGSLDRDMVSPS